MVISFIDIIDYLGTFAFAISGIRLASAKQFDLFGAFVVGAVTAIGGGTVRDLLLGVTPFWMLTSVYFIITLVALLLVMSFDKYVIRLNETLFLFDAIGLGLFTIVGMEKGLSLGFPFWIAITMGMTSGVVGGVIRDVLINEIPLIFRQDIYAMACIVGGIVYYIFVKFNLSPYIGQIVAALTVILVRVLSVHYGIGLPILRNDHTHEDINPKADK